VFYTHGGGMITGDRFNGADEYLAWVDELDIVVVAVEYRLAPEHADPTPVDDCYAALVWTAGRAEELGLDANRIVIAGASAGGGLAAGVSLKVRDLGGPTLVGSLLVSPMIDDRIDTYPSQRISGIGVWDYTSNETGWTALLGDRRGTDAVSPYAAPARANNLSGLPPTYVDCTTTEVFRDEDVAFASKIWAQGGSAELHVWPGGFHGFDALAPTARLSLEARAARVRWLRRVLRVTAGASNYAACGGSYSL
jgi:acetyl esterase/lipase